MCSRAVPVWVEVPNLNYEQTCSRAWWSLENLDRNFPITSATISLFFARAKMPATFGYSLGTTAALLNSLSLMAAMEHESGRFVSVVHIHYDRVLAYMRGDWLVVPHEDTGD